MSDEQFSALEELANPGHTAGMPVVPLLSEVVPNLWMGGCIPGARLPDDFRFVLSLTPNRYELGPDTIRAEYPFSDGPDVPPGEKLEALAAMVNSWQGLSLVHCDGGRNRSGLIVALALMRRGEPLDDVLALMRAKRSQEVLFNGAFVDWLRSVA